MQSSVVCIFINYSGTKCYKTRKTCPFLFLGLPIEAAIKCIEFIDEILLPLFSVCCASNLHLFENRYLEIGQAMAWRVEMGPRGYASVIVHYIPSVLGQSIFKGSSSFPYISGFFAFCFLTFNHVYFICIFTC